MNIKDKIIKAVRQNEMLYFNGEEELYNAIDNCYTDVIKVSKGTAFIFAEDDADNKGIFKCDVLDRMERLKNKTITIKDFFSVDIAGIQLHILITKEKITL